MDGSAAIQGMSGGSTLRRQTRHWERLEGRAGVQRRGELRTGTAEKQAEVWGYTLNSHCHQSPVGGGNGGDKVRMKATDSGLPCCVSLSSRAEDAADSVTVADSGDRITGRPDDQMTQLRGFGGPPDPTTAPLKCCETSPSTAKA